MYFSSSPFSTWMNSTSIYVMEVNPEEWGLIPPLKSTKIRVDPLAYIFCFDQISLLYRVDLPTQRWKPFRRSTQSIPWILSKKATEEWKKEKSEYDTNAFISPMYGGSSPWVQGFGFSSLPLARFTVIEYSTQSSPPLSDSCLDLETTALLSRGQNQSFLSR